MSQFYLNNENHQDLTTRLQDTIQQWCDENKLSGELAWLVAQSIATAQLQMFRSNKQ